MDVFFSGENEFPHNYGQLGYECHHMGKEFLGTIITLLHLIYL